MTETLKRQIRLYMIISIFLFSLVTATVVFTNVMKTMAAQGQEILKGVIDNELREIVEREIDIQLPEDIGRLQEWGTQFDELCIPNVTSSI